MATPEIAVPPLSPKDLTKQEEALKEIGEMMRSLEELGASYERGRGELTVLAGIGLALALILTGGEDHALAGTFDADAVPEDWWVIGETRAGEPAVLVDDVAWSGDETGWDHFAGRLTHPQR
jgi:hypothetical protein